MTSPEQQKVKNPLTKVAGLAKRALGFGDGFGCLIKGARFVYLDHRELARIYIVPMILSFFFIVGGLVLFGLYAADIINSFWSEPDKETWWGVLHVLWQILAVVLWLVFALVSALLAAGLFALVAAPFSDLLSENVEGIIGSWEARPFSLKFMLRDLGYTVRLEVFRASVKIAWLVPLFVVNLVVPVIGSWIYIIVGGYLLSKYTGMDYIDWCAARRGWSWQDRLAFAKRHRLPLAGLGTAVILALMIPLAFVVVWPAAVAGGAMLFNSLCGSESGETPSSK